MGGSSEEHFIREDGRLSGGRDPSEPPEQSVNTGQVQMNRTNQSLPGNNLKNSSKAGLLKVDPKGGAAERTGYKYARLVL